MPTHFRGLVEKMEALWHKRVKAALIPPAGVKIKPLPPSKRKKTSKKNDVKRKFIVYLVFLSSRADFRRR